MNKRYRLLDVLRGLTLLNMILYHGMWDAIHFFGVQAPWYDAAPGFFWQQSICWTFILLSGFCWGMGRHSFRRGATIFLCGGVVTAVTLVAMPESSVLFGVLTFLGSAMLLTAALHPLLSRMPAWGGIAGSAVLFCFLRQVNAGTAGLFTWRLTLPAKLYQNLFTAWLGFPPAGFYSTDYFSVLPWIFLYLTGYYGFRLFAERALPTWMERGAAPLEFVGRHSLLIYMLHQPMVYLVLLALSSLG